MTFLCKFKKSESKATIAETSYWVIFKPRSVTITIILNLLAPQLITHDIAKETRIEISGCNSEKVSSDFFLCLVLTFWTINMSGIKLTKVPYVKRPPNIHAIAMASRFVSSRKVKLLSNSRKLFLGHFQTKVSQPLSYHYLSIPIIVPLIIADGVENRQKI